MLNNPDIKVLSCMERLASPEFTPLMDWLRANREGFRNQLETMDGTMFQRAQGAAQTVSKFVDLVEHAPQLKQKLKPR